MVLNASTGLLKPLGWGKSLLYFGIPTLILHFIFRVVMRVLDALAFRLLSNFLLTFAVPSFLLLLAALWFCRRDGYSLPLLKERLRLEKPDRKIWIWSLVLSAVWIGGFIILHPLSDLIQANWISPPKLWLRLIAIDSEYFMEIPRKSIWVLIGMIFFVLANVLGEEIFFKGYVFPRQEAAFQSSTWIVHGVLTSIVHSILIWEFPLILLTSFTVSYVVQRTKSTWPALIAHLSMLAAILLSL